MLTLALAFALALVHLLAGRVRALEAVPRNRALSFFGGIAVAYVFAHLLPEVARGGRGLAHAEVVPFAVGEEHVWLLVLAGLAAFYGLERAAVRSRAEGDEAHADRTEAEVFWLHMASYGVYNVLIGYLLTTDDASLGGLLLYAGAMGLHFLVNDVGLRDHHKDRYHRRGRFVLAAAVVAGAAFGLVAEVPELAVTLVLAFLAGGVVLNVLKEELPEERESRFGPFLAGTAAYAALLLAL